MAPVPWFELLSLALGAFVIGERFVPHLFVAISAKPGNRSAELTLSNRALKAFDDSRLEVAVHWDSDEGDLFCGPARFAASELTRLYQGDMVRLAVDLEGRYEGSPFQHPLSRGDGFYLEARAIYGPYAKRRVFHLRRLPQRKYPRWVRRVLRAVNVRLVFSRLVVRRIYWYSWIRQRRLREARLSLQLAERSLTEQYARPDAE